MPATREDQDVVNRTGKVTKHRSLRVPDEQWERWHRAAELADITLTDLIRDAVDKRVARILKGDKR